MNPVIELRNLTKYYGDFLALDHINLCINEGEVFGFIGKNGAGKTTTINLVLSMLKASEGDIIIKGNTISPQNVAYKKLIGYVPDVPIFPHYLNASEYLTFTGDMFDQSYSNQKIEETLSFVGLEQISKQIGSFSRGMKQRLAIAQALIHDPEILIMDEPTSALDPLGRKDVLEIIKKLKGKKTIFYSTHILEDAEKVSDRIGLIDHGKIKLVKQMDDIKKNFIQPMVIVESNDNKKLEVALNRSNYVKGYKKHAQGYLVELEQSTTDNQLLSDLIQQDVIIKKYLPYLPSLEDVFIEVTS
ncbi:MAG: ABC transporter ATP-binding protein [Candidatus Izimaplasma sp.]|nr:ABC transporter ATP-binding protein [Candidatus Izimaplasma bacterium]